MMGRGGLSASSRRSEWGPSAGVEALSVEGELGAVVAGFFVQANDRGGEQRSWPGWPKTMTNINTNAVMTVNFLPKNSGPHGCRIRFDLNRRMLH